MPAQPSPHPRRRPAPVRSSARRGPRLDPPNAFQAPQHDFLREPPRPQWIQTADAALQPLPVAPLAAANPVRTARPVAWKVALFVSLAFHVAVAGILMLRNADEGVQIAGSQDAGIAMMGNAEADDSMAGEVEATNVTIVPMTIARPVETVAASAVEAVEMTQPLETIAETAAAESEVVEPVEQVAALTAEPVEPVRPSPTPVQDAESPAKAEAQPAPAEAQPAPAEIVPEVLAVDTPEIVAEDEAVAPVATPSTTAREPERLEASKPDVAVVPAETEREVVEAEPEPSPPVPKPEPRPPVAEKKPPREPEKPVAEKPAKKAVAKTEKRPAKAAPEKPARSAARAGSAGKGKSDARRGEADGETGGTRARKAGSGREAAAGNAAVTNYPGKVRGKISRAASRISRRDRASADRDVTVTFTVTAAGGLGGVSLARSSGSQQLDRAALAAVRRAAPFPPIPQGAGRRTWQFTIPMGLAR